MTKNEIVSEINALKKLNKEVNERTERLLSEMQEYLAKDTNEEQRLTLQRGDWVRCTGISCIVSFEGIFLGKDYEYYWILTEDDSVPQKILKNEWVLFSLGKHVDFFKKED